MPSFAAQTAVAFEPAPHQMRSRRPSRMRLEAQQPGRIGKHRPRIRLRKAFAAQQVEEHLGMAPPHVGVGLAFGRLIAEIPPAIDHLLGRSAADAELQASAGDEIGGAGVLGHVERVLVAHVDHRRADLDAAGLRADGRQQRERARRAGGRSDGRGNRRRPRPAPRRRRQARSIAAACPRPSGSAIAARASSARRRENRSSSCRVSIGALRC